MDKNTKEIKNKKTTSQKINKGLLAGVIALAAALAAFGAYIVRKTKSIIGSRSE